MDDPTPINARPKRRQPEAVEDLSLALRDRVLWPLEDQFRALSDEGRMMVAGAAAVVALGIGIVGFSALGSGGSHTGDVQVAAAPAPTAQPAPAPAKSEPAPTLHGAAPVFKAPQEDQAEVAGSKAVEHEAAAATADNTGNAATDTISSTPAAQPTDASTSATASVAPVDGPPAGPAAVAVARQFAAGFVVYETGGDKATIRKAFAATATPELTKALLRRPPRQPAGVKVPKAKVLNVVPAPSHGSIYPLSVSLLRVGVTSELRLEMEQLKHKGWRVTNVLG